LVINTNCTGMHGHQNIKFVEELSEWEMLNQGRVLRSLLMTCIVLYLRMVGVKRVKFIKSAPPPPTHTHIALSVEIFFICHIRSSKLVFPNDGLGNWARFVCQPIKDFGKKRQATQCMCVH
jgi:hypothetical protein